jgi:enterochelin esterase-like enzyme
MTLTGVPLFALMATAAVLGPLALVIWLRRRRTSAKNWLRTAAQFGLVLSCQLLAVMTLFLWVNNQYGFYTSWSDLFGRSTGDAKIHANGLVRNGEGRAEVITVTGGPGRNGKHRVLVWLPREYDDPSAQTTQFPVVMVLPGQPSTPETMYRHYDFGAVATAEIDRGLVRPFIAVFPPLMTNPPRDTECTNIKGGPQALTWLTTDVYQGVRRSFRVAKNPWSVMGWSTGAFCSVKLALRYPGQFAAAAGLGGYYEPLTDKTTGDLFHGQAGLRDQNSPLWLYQHNPVHPSQLLIVTGLQDQESYGPSVKFLDASRGDAGVSSLIFPQGGHNYHNYRTQLPAVLEWLNQVRPVG